ncbi:hypothetical protein CLV28_1659 [Sediminihabitans luteus]|uniref:Transcriptional regulator with AbiEi antitoxin domain of type IV toxin-antitoxin system n=1 Tax=Sediminihabitans luteus TaxID=1138585 RepID=A0A2M9CQQ3_9CELL|nr:hypothetical protein [Sediminihabitans luteus]PJJ74165.1 hypothetical protein CLV28_1659 [Sediminihabitans luteus]GII99018.1 hypothetical protein Slu03_13960 [Sediminihabitans luteus]
MQTLRAYLSPVVDPDDALVRPEHVGGAAAFDDLVRRGAVQVVRPWVAVARGTAVTPRVRARSLASPSVGGLVVAGRTAAWVHAGGEPPALLGFLASDGVRAPAHDPGRVVRYARILRSEVVDLGGVQVTSPLRTVLDVASSPTVPAHACGTLVTPLPDDLAAAARCVVRVCAATGIDPRGARRALELRHRWRGRGVARQVLDLAVAATLVPSGAAAGPELA